MQVKRVQGKIRPFLLPCFFIKNRGCESSYSLFSILRSCESGSLNSTLAKGKAILCFQSRSQRSATAAVRTVIEAEAVGLIYAQFPTKDVDMSWEIPSVQVDFIAGTKILSYMEATR